MKTQPFILSSFALVAGTLAFAQVPMTNGVITTLDETKGTISIAAGQPGTVGSSSEAVVEYKVMDGLVYNALKPGDAVRFVVEEKEGKKNGHKDRKEPVAVCAVP